MIIGKLGLTVQGQGKGRHDLAHTIAFLCLAKAISEAIDKNDTCKNSTHFLQDLHRWQELFEDAVSLDAYKEAVRLMWGIELNQRMNSSEKACQLETLVYFQALASALINQTRELLTYPCDPNRKGLESSQECWRRRFSEETSTPENKYGIFGSQSSRRNSTQVFGGKRSKASRLTISKPSFFRPTASVSTVSRPTIAKKRIRSTGASKSRYILYRDLFYHNHVNGRRHFLLLYCCF